MHKRAKGYDPRSGDWEYAVVHGDRSEVEAQGKLASCRSCHAFARETGFVFGSYRHKSNP